MRIVTHLLAVVAGAILILFPIRHSVNTMQQQLAMLECTQMRHAVETRLHQEADLLLGRIDAFGVSVAGNREFLMKYLVENDVRAPEVTDIAAAFIGPMGCSMLDLADHNGMVIASGHNAAANGMIMPGFEDAEQGPYRIALDATAENERLVLWRRSSFKCDYAPMHVQGGMVIDRDFLRRLCPNPSVTLVVRAGDIVLGTRDVAGISPVEKNRIIIDDTPALASSFAAPLQGSESERVEWIVIMPLPQRAGALKMFGL